MCAQKFSLGDVDQLLQKIEVNRVLTHYRKLPANTSSNEHRMECVFNESCSESQYGHLAVKLDAVNRIYCHSCGVRGNLLTLIHGLETGSAPSGGRLRGDEFKAAVEKLRQIAGQSTQQDREPELGPEVQIATAIPSVNLPMAQHEKDAARALADLHRDLISDVSAMNPEASEYVRARPWMTPELMQEWGVGWIPGNGRSLFRKNYLVYTHRNERGDVVSYSGRDLTFDKKWAKWIRDGKPEGKKPNKHRYVSGFHRGLELYGGQASRAQQPYIQESLRQRGVVVVEGMNEVLRMETLGVAAVGLGSNKATQTQVEKLIRFARQAGDGRIVLLPDCDEEGEKAFRELLWKLAEHVDVRLGCTSTAFDGQFAGRQPESYTDDEWELIDRQLRRS